MNNILYQTFDRFCREEVDLAPNLLFTAKSSCDYLIKQLWKMNFILTPHSNLIIRFVIFGSIQRNTKIKPLDDIDILMVLNGHGTEEVISLEDYYSSSLVIKNLYSPLSQYSNNGLLVNSTVLLNKIKFALGLVDNYKKAEIKKSMQAVVLNLLSYDWSFDIVPAILMVNKQGKFVYYLIPDGKGNWIRTLPEMDTYTINKANHRHNGNLLPLIKLLKYWKKHKHIPQLPSYYFETLVLQLFNEVPPIINILQALSYFFDNCGKYIFLPCPDSKKLGPNLDSKVDFDVKLKNAIALREAATNSNMALWFELLGNLTVSLKYWNNIFGPQFLLNKPWLL